MKLATTLKVLGDANRLRILRVLREETLNVGELVLVLGMAQSTVSKHLSALRRAGLVRAVRNGGYSYYEIRTNGERWLRPMMEELTAADDHSSDLVRLREVIRQRQEISESMDRFVVPGRSWMAWSRALKYLLPDLTVADFGCGDGAFTSEIAAWARHVYAIDSNADLLKLAQERCQNSTNIDFLREEMETVPLADGWVDLIVISQSLHYLPEPSRALSEAYRILKPGGRLLLLDLLPHEEQWVIEDLKHQWMGFDPARIKDLLVQAGFSEIELDTDTKQPPEPFRIIIASAIKESSIQ